jgi:hypothetical protein
MNNYSVAASSIVHSIQPGAGGLAPIQLFGYIYDIPKDSSITNKMLE